MPLRPAKTKELASSLPGGTDAIRWQIVVSTGDKVENCKQIDILTNRQILPGTQSRKPRLLPPTLALAMTANEHRSA